MEDNYNNDQFGFELKRALLEDTPLPDADKAFMQFKKNIGVKESRWKTLRPYLAVAMAACIAALCYLVLPLGEEDKMASNWQRWAMSSIWQGKRKMSLASVWMAR